MKRIGMHGLLHTVGFALVAILVIGGVIVHYNHTYTQRVLNAIAQDNIKEIQELVKFPIGNLNSKPTLWICEVLGEQNEQTPLQAACKSGNLEIVMLLVENGADVNYTHWDKSRNQGSPLTNAAGSLSDERLQVITFLVENGADIFYQDYAGNDVLSCAVYASFDRSDTIEIIEYLETMGADIYKRYSTTKNSLLHKACEVDSLLVIRYLVERRGFDVNMPNEDGDTALICFLRFASNRKEETLKYLIQSGANLEIKNKEGKTAYDYAVDRHPEFVELLRQGDGSVVLDDGS